MAFLSTDAVMAMGRVKGARCLENQTKQSLRRIQEELGWRIPNRERVARENTYPNAQEKLDRDLRRWRMYAALVNRLLKK